MKRKKPNTFRPLNEIKLKDLTAACGVQLLIWAKMVQEIDPNDYYEPFMEMADDMLVHSEVLTLIEKQYPVMSNHMTIKLPDHLTAVTIRNPLREQESEDPLPFDKGSTSDNMGDVPF